MFAILSRNLLKTIGHNACGLITIANFEFGMFHLCVRALCLFGNFGNDQQRLLLFHQTHKNTGFVVEVNPSILTNRTEEFYVARTLSGLRERI